MTKDVLTRIYRIGTSKPFRFLIGADQTEYTIHSALVAHQSPVLSALVHGSFRESSEHSVKWEDVDEVVFNSFWQFTYTGDYDTPAPLPPTKPALSEEAPKLDNSVEPTAAHSFDESAEEATEEAPIEEESAEAFEPAVDQDAYAISESPYHSTFTTPAPKAKKNKGKQSSETLKPQLWIDFLFNWDYRKEPVNFDVTVRDLANPLVHHAKVYTLADRYAVTRLMKASRIKLHRSLTGLPISEEANHDVVELVCYAFEELVPDELRDLVVHYVACFVENLWKIEAFQKLVEKHGNLSKALIGSMLLRMG
jgi:hypothetical protein